MNLKRAFAIGGRPAVKLLHALCVFLCTPSLMLNENPLEETSVREKVKKKTFVFPEKNFPSV